MAKKETSDTFLSPTKQALLKIRELKQQLAAVEAAPREDIAIVSVACRFPRHADSPEAFWESLIEGRDEVSDVPENRWDMESYFDDDPEAPGKMYARKGVFLDDLDLMDAEFFGISPREATWVDPQQRLLLEVSWEALERAGWPSDQIGEETGLFIGWMHNDYQNESSDSLLNLNPYIATGSAGSFLSGRLSYYLGLEGPSVAVDSACSSSLVAVHLACQALQRRECNRALVGGVNAILSPTTNILTCKLKALSPQGHSRAFDATADGYLRGEGCGVVALRRLSDAVNGDDPILAVIRGSAVGHNGFSSGLTAPNPKAQERVIRDALAAAKLTPGDVDYLEAHGTGTELGDPIEMNAAAAALGDGRDKDAPLLIGSVKTNIGHLEAAAGMAGLIKVVLAMQNGVIPKQLGFETPNPHIAWDKMPVEVVVEPKEWPKPERRIASVSAFGMSGTNAHVVLHSAPERSNGNPNQDSTGRQFELLTLSGKTQEAVQDHADRLARWMPQSHDLISNVAHTLRTGRRHFEQRIAVVCDSKETATKELQMAARGGRSDGTFQGSHRRTPLLAWQFTGQGAQFPRMAHELYQNVSVFREALDKCERWMKPIRDESLLDVLFSGDKRIHHTSWTQPGMFAIEMGLACLLSEWGIEPDFVMGHSVGQYAAACVAGFMSWEDGLRLISERGRLLGNLPEDGRMAAVFSNLDTVQEHVAQHECLSIAAMNGSHIVISGQESSVDAVIQTLSDAGVRCKPLTTSHAFHSPLMDPALDDFEAFADAIDYQAAHRPLVCNVTGTILSADTKLSGSYWRKHIREAVQYASSISALANAGCDVVLELGPRRVLTNMASSAWPSSAPTLVSCLQDGVGDQEAILRAMAQLYAAGVNPDLTKFSNNDSKRIVLPTYPFQRKKYWGPPKPQAQHAAAHTQHPLVGEKWPLAGVKDEVRHESVMNAERLGWIGDHQVMGEIVFPGAAYIEMALNASGATNLQNVAFEQPLRLSRPHHVQTVTAIAEEKKVQIFAHPESTEQWTRHFTCQFGDSELASTNIDKADILKSCEESIETERYYEMLRELGLNYGPDFQCIRELHYGDRDVLARLELQSDLQGYKIPPMLLDQAFVSLAIGVMRDSNGSLFLPVGIESFSCRKAWSGTLWCHGKFDEPQDGKRTGNLVIFDEQGEVIAHVEQLQLRELSRAAIRQMSGGGADRLISEVSWVQKRIDAPTNLASTWLVVSDDSFNAQPLLAAMQDENQNCYQVVLNDRQDATVNGAARFSGGDVDQWCELLRQFGTNERKDLDGVIWVAPTADRLGTEDDILAYAQSQCSSLLAFLSSAQRTETHKLRRGLQIITTGAVATNKDETISPLVAQLWGTGRVIGAELPGLKCRMVDLDLNIEGGAESLVSVVLSDSNENQIAIRDGESLVARLRYHKAAKHDEPFSVSGDGSFLITGGLGMLGRRAAAWLASRGAKHIVLVSRRAPGDELLASVNELEEIGCSIEIGQADISSPDDASALMARFGTEWPQLRGVIHAAGVLDDALVGEQTWERFEKVLAPKVRGAWALHELTKAQPLDFFILYSSAASVLGSPGQSNYATGNAYLDGLAQERRSCGLPALSINWGPWDAGMADDENILKRMKLQGITPLSSDESHRAMEQLLQDGTVQATVLDADWRRLRMSQPGEPPFLEMIAPTAGAGKGQAGNTAFMEEFRAAKGKAKRELLGTMLQTQLQEVLSSDTPPDADTPVIDFGLDSLMAVEFSTRLQEQLGGDMAIAPTLLYDYPTITSLTDYFFDMLDSPEEESAAAKEDKPSETNRVDKDDIAIIGMSCRFPGADGIDEYWRNLLDGKDSVREIPADRWDVEEYYSPEPTAGKMYTKEGGFLDKIADFDAEFFGISDQEACWIDPQHRLLLEVGWESLESANIVPGSLKDPSVGVFMGIMSNDYAELHNVDDIDVIDGFQGAGLAHSAGVGRVSYMFGFEGPSVAVDSASSSSLVAVCQAIKSLQDHDCNMALAGGVNAILSPSNSLLLSKAKMLSPDGRCKSFSAKADGFARGEGCGVVVLKRLQDAERDGDNILAVIQGSAVSHNGFSGGLTSPSGRSQEKLIQNALENAGVRPTEVDYLEAHGTGTEFGDPIEIHAAGSVLGKGRSDEDPLLVGTVKPNIGHLEAAGGVSGLIKAVLSMHHGLIPRQIHFDDPSPHVPWKQLAVRMVTEQTEWPARGTRRVAGVTALGMSGTNAHVILTSHDQEVDEKHEQPASDSSLIVLSAKSEERLSLAADALAQFAVGSAASLNEIGYSAATGRKSFAHRMAIVANSKEEMSERLRDQVHGREHGCPNSNSTAWIFGPWEESMAGVCNSLYEREPILREVIDTCADFWSANGRAEFSSTVLGGGKAELPEVFSTQVAIGRLLESWGLEPDVVMGLGEGELAATCLAGVLNFDDSLRLVNEVWQRGGKEDEAELDRFEEACDQLDYFPTDRPLISCLSGQLVPLHRLLGGSYWRRHAEESYDVADCASGLDEFGVDSFVCFGDLSGKVAELQRHTKSQQAEWIPLEAVIDRSKLLSAVGRLFVAGSNPIFESVLGADGNQRVQLPTTPFLRKRYWLTDVSKYKKAAAALQ